MFHSRIEVAPKAEPHEGLIAEAVRRLIRRPRFAAAADREALRELVLAEIRKGTLTLFGLVRAVERGH